jgi:class 3 adenylate cyclase
VERQAAVERRIVSVLFADLVGFTALSERLDAEDVAGVQDAYFAIVRETIARHGGVLEKFIGDAAMAVFGVPRTREDDAERAVRAGLALAAAVEALGPRLGMEDAALLVRVGITTGEVAFAVDGLDAGRVTGDAVNVAARLQAAAPVGGVLVSEATALAVAETIEVGPTIALELKGKSEPVRVALAIGALAARSRERAMGGLHAVLVGRDADLRWLADQIAAVPRGASRSALISAPAGTGKSRFVTDAGAAALRDGTLDAVWTARLRAGGAPFEGLREICIAALRESGLWPPPGSPEGVTALGAVQAARLSEHLAATGGLVPTRSKVVAAALLDLITEGQPTGASTTGLADWLDGLDVLGAGKRVMWVMEDLHWAGTDLLAALAALEERLIPGRGSRLVLGTARPAFLAPAGGLQGGNLPAAERRELPPLPPEASLELVRALVGEALPAAVVEQIGLRSEGNPLFVEELLRTWVAAGTLEPDPEGRWRLTVPVAVVAVPATVQAIYAAQIDDLAPDARTVLRRASVAGRRFPAGALPDLDVSDPAPSVGRLVAAGAVTGPTMEELLGDVYAYRHALLRDAAYASLARTERARLHVALARWLEVVAGDRANQAAAQIGGHYAAAADAAPSLARIIAPDLDRDDAAGLAADWLERAGDAALAGSAPRAAHDLYQAAMRSAAPERRLMRARLVAHLGIATARTADLADSQALLHEAMELFRSLLGGPDRAAAREGLAEAADELARGWYDQIRFADARVLAEQSLAAIGAPVDPGPDLPAARLRMRAAIAEHAATDADTSEAIVAVAGEARAAGDRRLELTAMNLASSICLEIGLADPFGWEETAALARSLGEWGLVMDHLIDRALTLVDDHPAEALPLLQEAQELAEERGFTEQTGWIDYVRSEGLAVSGDLAGAEAAAERAIAVADRNGYARVAVRTYHVLVPVAAARGDLGPATRLAAFYAARDGTFPDSGYARVMRGAMQTFIAAAKGQPAVPLDLDARLAALAQVPANPSLLLAIERSIDEWIAVGQVVAARQALRAVESGAQSTGTSDLGRATIHLLAARIALAEGHRDAADDNARAALAAFRAIPAPWWMAKSLAMLVALGRANTAEAAELTSLRTRLGLV